METNSDGRNHEKGEKNAGGIYRKQRGLQIGDIQMGDENTCGRNEARARIQMVEADKLGEYCRVGH